MRWLALAGAAILAVAVGTGCSSAPPRTAAEFCTVYHQQEQQYLSKYDNSSPNEPLTDMANLIGAMSDWVPIFQALDNVAPPSIEPDVHTILDSLKQQEQAAGEELSDPLGALGSGLEASMMSSASWDNLSAYISAHCGTGA